MAQAPPAELLTSAWFPLIADFAGKASRALVRGQVVTSWWRDPDTNARVGGHPESQHLFGLAIDVTGPHLEFTAFLARRAGLIAILDAGRVHLQYLGAGTLARAGVTFPRAATAIVQTGGQGGAE